jgi:hypothetical protein
MAMSSLRLTYEPEDEWHGELRAVVTSDGFAGVGSAWFTTDELRAFCDRLGDYPLRPDALPVLAGGYWKLDADVREQTHLSIRISPHNASGALRVSATLAEPGEADDDPERVRRAETWFVVAYNDLSRFQSALKRVLLGQAVEATLQPAPN